MTSGVISLTCKQVKKTNYIAVCKEVCVTEQGEFTDISAT